MSKPDEEAGGFQTIPLQPLGSLGSTAPSASTGSSC